MLMQMFISGKLFAFVIFIWLTFYFKSDSNLKKKNQKLSQTLTSQNLK